MYKALVHTVPGSGTRFVCEFTEKCLGYRRSHTHLDLIADSQNNTYCHTHVYQHLDDVALHESVRIVTPLRHPYLAYLTRRYRVGAAKDSAEAKQKIIALHWRELLRKSKYMNMLFVPIEEGFDRARSLNIIANCLHAPVKCPDVFQKMVGEWPKVGTAGPRKERQIYESTGLIDGVEPHFLDFAVEWYKGIVLELEAVE